jgi:ATP-binding cassette subfamily B (MDR/TAP) protein 1
VINEEPCYTEISDDRYTAGMVVVCFFSIVLGGFSLVSFGPSIEKIIAGKQAAARIFAVIDREPEIKDESNAIKI